MLYKLSLQQEDYKNKLNRYKVTNLILNRKLRRTFFKIFFILAFNAANISLLSPKVAAGAFVEELDEVF
jgi:hypothetical protein